MPKNDPQPPKPPPPQPADPCKSTWQIGGERRGQQLGHLADFKKFMGNELSRDEHWEWSTLDFRTPKSAISDLLCSAEGSNSVNREHV